MIIKSALLNRKRYHFVDESVDHGENVFSVVIGVNGVGKSRLISRVMANLKNIEIHNKRQIPHTYSNQVGLLYNKSNYSLFANSSSSTSYLGNDNKQRLYDNVKVNAIAVTTSPFDQFPVDYKLNSLSRYDDNETYHYIGLRVSENSYNKSNFLNRFSRFLLNKGLDYKFQRVFKFLGYANYVRIRFKTKMPNSGTPFNATYKDISIDNFLDLVTDRYPTIGYGLQKDPDLLKHVHKVYRDYSHAIDYGVTIEGNDKEYEALALLLGIGLIQVKGLYLLKGNGKFHDISNASSGEQCVMLTILNIAGVIKDNSVICIDEPEISLHPDWQKKFMPLIMDSFKDYKKCHFIISTHSPLIISELNERNCFILNMSENEVSSSHDFRKKSADYQLAELFETPGYNNEYLNRLVVSLLTTISRKGELEKADKKTAKELIAISPKLDDDDTVKHLIEILRKTIDKIKEDA